MRMFAPDEIYIPGLCFEIRAVVHRGRLNVQVMPARPIVISWCIAADLHASLALAQLIPVLCIPSITDKMIVR